MDTEFQILLLWILVLVVSKLRISTARKTCIVVGSKLMAFYNTFEASKYVAYLVDSIIR